MNDITSAFNVRVIRLHRCIGSGIVRVIGPPCCGKTTSVLTVLDEQPRKQHRSEGGAETEHRFEEDIVVYFSCSACNDLRALSRRLYASLDGQNRPARGHNQVVAGDAAEALMNAGAAGVHVHVVVDDVDSPLSPGSATDVAAIALQWFALAKYPRHVTIWLIAQADFPVSHASRPAYLAAPSRVEMAGRLRGGVNPTLSGFVAAALGNFVLQQKPEADSAPAADFRRVVARCDAIVHELSPNELEAFQLDTPANQVKRTIDLWLSGPKRGHGGSGTLMTDSCKLVFTACFLSAVLTKAQLQAVLGDGPSGSLPKRKSTSTRTAVHSFAASQVMMAYEGLSKIADAQRRGAAENSTPLPPARIAMHHLTSLEAQGCVTRVVNNHELFHCRISFAEASSVASSLGVSLTQLLPKQG